jgi:hypothetical protein
MTNILKFLEIDSIWVGIGPKLKKAKFAVVPTEQKYPFIDVTVLAMSSSPF